MKRSKKAERKVVIEAGGVERSREELLIGSRKEM